MVQGLIQMGQYFEVILVSWQSRESSMLFQFFWLSRFLETESFRNLSVTLKVHLFLYTRNLYQVR